MDIVFLALLTMIFVAQIIMLFFSIKNNKKHLILVGVLLEIIAILIAVAVTYYFSEVVYKYASNFEGFFQIAGGTLFVFLYFIMFVITSIVLVIKTAKNK